jgi:glyoxylase-like metal-dependent hydrolase (beta-lactamase superfamily II)
MTLDGTNGYIVDGGDGAWIAIDPGPDAPEHIAAFVDAANAAGAHYDAILITHGHPDHYPAAAPLSRAFRTIASSPKATACAPVTPRCSRCTRPGTRAIISSTCSKASARSSPGT